MKAVFCTQYGSPEVLQLREVAKPLPGSREVLVSIHASSVTMGDCELRNLTLPAWTRLPMRLLMGYRKPRNFTPGMEVSGVVEAVGKDVSAFQKGDAIFGSGGFRMGANAEYACYPARYTLANKPHGLSHNEAATIAVGGINALHFLRKANIQPGQKVLVIGAGGSIGTYGVQLAKFYGAEVTAVDRSDKLEMLKAIGADHVIDYTKEDFSSRGQKDDVIFDIVYKSSFSKCLHSLSARGYYLMANSDPLRMLLGWLISKTGRKKIYSALAAERKEDLAYIASLIVEGKIKVVIDKVFSLEEIAEAHRYVEAGSKKGNVVVSVRGDHNQEIFI